VQVVGDTTVKTHVTHVFQKLNVRDRVQAVVLAHQAGLFELASEEPRQPPTEREGHTRSG
jgi:hypothetical protein